MRSSFNRCTAKMGKGGVFTSTIDRVVFEECTFTMGLSEANWAGLGNVERGIVMFIRTRAGDMKSLAGNSGCMYETWKPSDFGKGSPEFLLQFLVFFL